MTRHFGAGQVGDALDTDWAVGGGKHICGHALLDSLGQLTSRAKVENRLQRNIIKTNKIRS